MTEEQKMKSRMEAALAQAKDALARAERLRGTISINETRVDPRNLAIAITHLEDAVLRLKVAFGAVDPTA